MLTFQSLWPILAVPAVVGILAAGARRSVPPLSRRRRGAALAARTAAASLAALSLGRPALLLRTERPFLTVFVLDVSESIPERASEATAGLLRKAWDGELGRGNACSLVAFAGRAEVLVPPGRHPFPAADPRLSPRASLKRLGAAAEQARPEDPDRLAGLQRWSERLETRATDIAGALRTARGLSLEGTVPRIVLITDGRDTKRPAAEIDLREEDLVAGPAETRRRDTAIVGVEAPLTVREGEPFDVRVAVESTEPQTFTLSLMIDDAAVPGARGTFRIPAPGRHVLVLPNVRPGPSPAAGLHTLLVLLDAEGDEEPRNNVGAAAFSLGGKPRVLLLEGTPAEGAPLARLLRAQDLDLVVESPARLPAGTGGFEDCVAVILVGVPREALSSDLVRALSHYVESHGGGLWVVGSASLRGERGYGGTEIEKLLPVTFLREEPGRGGGDSRPGPGAPAAALPAGDPQKVLAPVLALLFIVDKSGSMAGNNIAIVKEACIASARMLSPKDVVGVLAFDARPKWILEFTEADRQEYVADRVLRLLADGGTNLQPALEEALRAFREDPRARRAGVKHAILLSDGDTLPGHFESSVRRLAEAGVTVTTVCVPGPRTDQHLLYQIAAWGKGRFMFAPGFDRVPQIFVHETRRVLGTVPRDPPAAAPDPSVPAPPPSPPGPAPVSLPVAVREDHEILQGIDRESLPRLQGVLRSAARRGASVPLAAGGDLPLLALGRVGLGKSAVWTSDVSGRWSAEWLSWPAAGKLFAQLVRHLSSAVPDTDLAGRLHLSLAGDRARIRIDPGPGDEALRAVTAPSGPPQDPSRGPDGTRIFEIPLGRPGELRRVLLQRPDGKNLWIGAIRAYEEEFAPPCADRDLFAGRAVPISWTELERRLEAAKIPGERRQDLCPWLIAAAALMLSIDVGIRRYSA